MRNARLCYNAELLHKLVLPFAVFVGPYMTCGLVRLNMPAAQKDLAAHACVDGVSLGADRQRPLALYALVHRDLDLRMHTGVMHALVFLRYAVRCSARVGGHIGLTPKLAAERPHQLPPPGPPMLGGCVFAADGQADATALLCGAFGLRPVRLLSEVFDISVVFSLGYLSAHLFLCCLRVLL
jgi:hypothetical protein